ncbi:class I SAM-dependent methyltransferase [Flavisolibacter sp. BT320]|nr:class I SAM-dependent methyltransferase [Flavisolibacter longurius]
MNELQTAQPDITAKYAIDLTKREAIKCPLCSRQQSKLAHTLQSWKIVQCEACQFVYVNPRLVKDELLKLYVSDYFDNQLFGYFHYSEGRDFRKRNFQKWVKDALPYVTQAENIKALDIGCASGYCLEVFQEQGWQAHGVELDHTLAKELRRKGFTVYDSPLLHLGNIGKYDIITMFDVIEHLTDLHENVSILNQLVADNGIVVLVTPNYGSWQRLVFQKKWFQFKPVEHINYFTLPTLQKLFETNGFKILKSKKSGQFCTTDFLANRISQYKLGFMMPLLRAAQKILRKKDQYFYVDTASLYIVLQKKESGK